MDRGIRNFELRLDIRTYPVVNMWRKHPLMDLNFASILKKINDQSKTTQCITIVLDGFREAHLDCLNSVWFKEVRQSTTCGLIAVKIGIFARDPDELWLVRGDTNDTTWRYTPYRQLLLDDCTRQLEPDLGPCTAYEERAKLVFEFRPHEYRTKIAADLKADTTTFEDARDHPPGS